MAYKKGDVLEITKDGVTGVTHAFRKGDQVTVTAVFDVGTENEHYKCDRDDNGRKASWYVPRTDLVKRRK